MVGGAVDLRVEGVEPTNNGSERALRPAVLWRKGSFGADSEAGSRFVERLLTVVATCHQQSRPVLDFLMAAGEAALRDSRCRRCSLHYSGTERLQEVKPWFDDTYYPPLAARG